MNIIQRAVKALNRMVFPMYGGSSNWLYYPSATTYDVTLTDSSLVMAIVGWISRTLPEAPLQVVRTNSKGEREVIGDHALPALLENPNPYYGGLAMWMGVYSDWVTEGNAYLVKIRNGQGAVIQLWWIPDHLIEPKWEPNSNQFIGWYEYTVDGRVIKIEPKDIIHFRYGLDPYNPRKGLSPLASLVREVYTDEEAAAFSASLLKNMGVPGIIISPEGDFVHEVDAGQIKDRMKAATTGANRGDPIVMSAAVKVSMLSFNPQQMNLKDMRRLPEERVAAVMGIPAIVVGFGAGMDRSTFANYAEARESAYEGFVIPTQRLFASDLKTQLLPEFGEVKGLKIEHDNSGVRVLQEDENAKAVRWGTLVKDGVAMLSEARSAMGLPVEKEHEVFLRPMAIVETGPGAPEPEPPTVTVEQAPPPQLTDSEKAYANIQTKAYSRQVEAIERRATSATLRYLNAQYEAAARAIEGTKERQLPLDFGDDIAALWNKFYPLIIKQSWDDVAAEIGVELAFDLENIYVQRVLGDLAKEVRKVADTTKQEIRDLVSKQASEGWSIDELAKEIRALKEIHSMARARVIARTETAYAYSKGSMLGYKEAGVEAVEWLVTEPCELCAPNANKVIKIGENFPSGHPHPPAHPDCRCAIVAVLE